MIINDILNKIKGKLDIDMIFIMCFCIIILVGFASFGLGRLSIVKNDNNSDIVIKNENIITDKTKEIIDQKIIGNSQIQTQKQEVKRKMYVASKNGKLYYGAGCSGAKRISPSNEIWFSSSSDAEKAGYTPSSSCK